MSYVGRGFCYELITHPKESYHVSNEIKKPKKRGLGPAWAVKATDDDDDGGGDDDDDDDDNGCFIFSIFIS
jgi:hypothetical protein